VANLPMAWNEYDADLKYKIQNGIWRTRKESQRLKKHKQMEQKQKQ